MLYSNYSKLFPTFLANKLAKFIMNKLNKNTKCVKNTCSPSGNQLLNPNSVHNFDRYEVLASPIKSASDKKDYKVIRLPNQLTACLISDKSPIEETDEDDSESDISEDENEISSEEDSKESDESESEPRKADGSSQKMAAAGLCIGVGSFSDPKEVPGMAHFLEHMVFMGSQKFPSENDFDAFIKKGGGSDNASTDAETTVFYFECLEKHLEQALDKFAQFFIAPLMKKEAMTRERDAIESEFQMSLQSDLSRQEQLLCCLAREGSPVNSFAWGNLKTLRDNISDDKLYEGVHAFRKRHYSAHRMTLAIQARLPMEKLEKIVVDSFSNVPNNNLPPDDFSAYKHPVFDTSKFHRIYYVKPVKNQKQVILTWNLPSLQHKYRSKSEHYLSLLIGDEGPGSLLSYLKKKVWAISTSVGNSESGLEHNSLYMLFSASIVLTDQGLSHLKEVIEAVFSYINMLKKIGPQERIFYEAKSVYDTAFKFATEDESVDNVENICEEMQIYPPEDYIAGSELFYEYDPEGISQVLEMLTPRNVNIMVMSEELPEDVKYDKVEKWFGTNYTDRDIPADWSDKWEKVDPYPELCIPPPNPYLTNNFDLLEADNNHPEYPEKVAESPLFELWYRKDQKFALPIAYYYIYLISPKSVESAESATMMETMMNLIVYTISEELYPASSADLSCSFTCYEKGLIIKVSGYNEKLPVIFQVISKHLTQFSERLENEDFMVIKDKLLKAYRNRLLKPSALAKNLRLNLLTNPFWSPISKSTELKKITLEQTRQFIKEYFNALYVKALVQGNVTREIARTTINEFIENLGIVELPKDLHPKFSVLKVPTGEKCYRVKGLNKDDTNSIVTNYYQASNFSMKDSVIIEIIMMLIEEPLFDILRTKEQLGYHVYCSIRDTFGILGYTITVNSQATKHTTKYVDQRIEEFLKHSLKLLQKTERDELDIIKEDLIKTKQCEDVDLKEEVERNWSEIVSDDYIFDRIPKEIEAIRNIKFKEILEWWKMHNQFGKKDSFRKLSIQVVGSTTNGEDKNIEDTLALTGKDQGDSLDSFSITLATSLDSIKEREDYFIKDPTEFKKGLPVYPSVHVK